MEYKPIKKYTKCGAKRAKRKKTPKTKRKLHVHINLWIVINIHIYNICILHITTSFLFKSTRETTERERESGWQPEVAKTLWM